MVGRAVMPGPKNRVSFRAAWVHYDSRSERHTWGIHLVRLGKPIPTPSANSLTLNERKSHETSYSLSKSVALSQELQTKSCHSNPTGTEAERRVPPNTCRSSNQK